MSEVQTAQQLASSQASERPRPASRRHPNKGQLSEQQMVEQGELRQPTPREPQQRTKLQRLSKAELVRLHDHLQSVGQGNSLRFQHVCNELAKR